MEKLSHTDDKGKVRMVDVGNKPDQQRIARATGHICLNKVAMDQIKDNINKKGDVLTVSVIAGIQAAKKTSELIPLCHPLPISKIEVKSEPDDTGIRINSILKCVGKTGIEMEAMTAVSIGLLTIYDMCKAVDKKMIIDDIRLVEKIKK